MAKLGTDYQDDILDTSANSKRKFRMINNSDGTVSFEDATVYTKEGTYFGGADVNTTNAKVNELDAKIDALTPVEPGGNFVLSVLSKQAISFTPEHFETNGNIIIGTKFNNSTIIVSKDNGDTWDVVELEKVIGCIAYSKYDECFVVAEYDVVGKMSIGKSSDGLTWSWDILTVDSDASYRYLTFAIDATFDGNKIYYARRSSVGSSYYFYCGSINDKSGKKTSGSVSSSSTTVSNALYRTNEALVIPPSANSNIHITITKEHVVNAPVIYKKKSGTSGSDVYAPDGLSNGYLFANGIPQTGTESHFYFTNKFDSKDSITAIPVPSGKAIRGFFTVGRYTYAYDQTTIGRASGVYTALALPASAFNSIGELIGIQAVHVLNDNSFIASTNSGDVYKCAIV